MIAKNDIREALPKKKSKLKKGVELTLKKNFTSKGPSATYKP